MSTFALLWGKILDSSLWVKESKETRLVWVTILAMKDADGRVFASVIGLADRAKVSVEECRAALKVFLSSDPDDTSKVEDGRRLREIPGGWQVVNNDLYRFSTEEKREFWRQQKADQRSRKEEPGSKRRQRARIKNGKPLPGEVAYEKAVESGAAGDIQKAEGGQDRFGISEAMKAELARDASDCARDDIESDGPVGPPD